MIERVTSNKRNTYKLYTYLHTYIPTYTSNLNVCMENLVFVRRNRIHHNKVNTATIMIIEIANL